MPGEKTKGVIIGGILISIIRFSNYIVLLATSENDLQTALMLVLQLKDQLKYLGSIIINDGRSEKEIKNRVRQAKKAFLVNYKLLTSKI